MERFGRRRLALLGALVLPFGLAAADAQAPAVRTYPKPQIEGKIGVRYLGEVSLFHQDRQYAVFRRKAGAAASIYDSRKRRIVGTVPAGCEVNDLSHGLALLACEHGQHLVFEISTRRSRVPRGIQAGDEPRSIGRHWIFGDVASLHTQENFYAQWRTGRRLSCLFGQCCDESPRGACYRTEEYDLDLDYPRPRRDARELRLERQRLVDAEGRYGLRYRARRGRRELLLVASGQRARVLDRSCANCEAQIEGRRVLWTEPTRSLSIVRAYDIQSQRRVTWRVKIPGIRPGYRVLAGGLLTKYQALLTVHASVDTTRESTLTWHLYATKWPRRR